MDGGNRATLDQAEWLRITLSSIGDAVIATDAEGRINFMNGVAETLTGWDQATAVGRPLEDVFRIVNEHTRAPAENPARRALRDRVVVGLANHSALVARDGTERLIDDSAAPVRSSDGTVVGVVLVFRDVTERRRADEARSRLAAIVESSEDAIIGKSLDGTIQSWNAGAERLFGYAAVEALGRPVTILIPPELLDEETSILDRIRRGQRVEPFETVRVTRDGRRIDISLTVSPVRDATGRVIGAAKIARDITARKRAEIELARITAESERRKRLYETALSSTPDLVYVFDLDHRFIYANEALLAVWGKTWDEAIGRNCLELGYEGWHASMHDREIEHVRQTKVPIRGEVPFTGTNGRRVYDYIFVPVFGATGEVEAVAGTTRDVTDRQAMEQQLRDADRKKDDFIALLAHELRNPLAPIRNGLEILRLSRGDGEAATRAREMMDRQLSHLVRLVDDLLDVSRINRSKMELRRARVSLAEIVASAVETVRPLIEEAQHELTVTLPPVSIFLDADLTRLAQVFSNLLTNSAKYTPEGGHIQLTAECHAGQIIVTVGDNGIGIPAEALPDIFDMFSQVDRTIERTTGGLGIGLALVRGLVEMHGGTVTASSGGQDQGSTFTVTLPTEESAAPIPALDGSAPATSPRRRVLVVDDNPDGAESLAMMLRLLGDEVETANDGLEAIERAAAFRPNVILMDVGMPRLNGLDATRRIRAEPWGTAIRIIALTGWGQEADRAQSRDAGCDGHLVKPVNLADLEQMLAGPESSR